jgi:hypothetical protein
MPARKLAPLDLATMPTDARYDKKFPLQRPTLRSRKAPFTNEARVTPLGWQPRLQANAGASSPAGQGDHTSPQRRVPSRSYAAPLVHTQSSSAGPYGMPPLQPW